MVSPLEGGPVVSAIVRSGGKQYRVREGSVINVASLTAQPGERVELREVLLLADGEAVTVGTPTVEDAVVVAEVVEHGRARKVINFRYKAKARARRKRGHRQAFTRLTVREIRVGAAPGEAPARPARRKRAAEPAGPAAEVDAPAPARRARTRKAEAPAEPEGAAAVEPRPAPRRRRAPPTGEARD
jgi:large subunit ribosomal protein L21